MRLLEDKIRESVRVFRNAYDHPSAEDYEHERNALWVYHQERFFDTLIGYHKAGPLVSYLRTYGLQSPRDSAT